MKPPTPLTDAFLADLHTRMKLLNLRKTQLARDINTSKTTLNRYFQRLRSPSGEYILKIQNWMKNNL